MEENQDASQPTPTSSTLSLTSLTMEESKDPSLLRAKALSLTEDLVTSLISIRPNISPSDLTTYKNGMRVLLGQKPHFQYSPLNRNTQEIRVIILHPSNDPTSEPFCDIHHVSLSSEYFALSYVWGDASDTRPITIDGQTLMVTANLELALRHVRLTEDPVVFWIDAICINQSDIEERSYVVGMMREIYENALLVIAWLGPQYSDREEKAFELIFDLAKRFQGDRYLVTDETSIWIAKSVAPNFEGCKWIPLLELLERPWFRRVWIVQEVVVGKKVAVHCGTLRLSFDDFIVAILAVSAYLATIAQASNRHLVERDHVENTERVKRNDDLNDRFGNAVYHVKMLWQSQVQRQGRVPSQTAFYDLVRIYNYKEATDPRDKVFALLGIADREKHKEVEKIVPDYGEDPRGVYVDLTRLHIETHGDLRFLFECCGPERPEGFPSWCPFWEQRFNPNVLRAQQVDGEIVFKAAGDSKIEIDLSVDKSVLKVRGILVDVVKEVGALYETRLGELLEGEPYIPDTVWKSWADMLGVGDKFRYSGQPEKISAVAQAVASEDYLRGEMCKYDAFMRTMVMNPKSDMYIDNWNSKATSDKEKGIRSAPRLDEDGEQRRRLSKRSDRCCLNRRFFLTEIGYMGLGLPEVRKGDLVIVIFGVEVPFVVRREWTRVEWMGGDIVFRDPELVVVGEAYVQGLMDGEVMREMEEGRAEGREFELR